MNISVFQNFPINTKLNTESKRSNSFVSYADYSDTFVKSQENNNKNVSFKGLFSGIFKKAPEPIIIKVEPATPTAERISTGIQRVMGERIPAANFNNVVSANEFRELLESGRLEEENFTSTVNNQENGVYSIDLDYQSNFSGGDENIYEILENVVEYANEYYERTGEEFIFAITDRDSVEGIQNILREIGSEPNRYRHLKILPAVKLSFAHEAPKSQLGFENSELLVYGINPFSDNITKFIERTVQKRKETMLNFIKEVDDLYPELECNVKDFTDQNDIKCKKDFTISNLYWRIREYAQAQGGQEIKKTRATADIDDLTDSNAMQVFLEVDNIMASLDNVLVGSDEESHRATGSSIDINAEYNKKLEEVFREYSTHRHENGEIHSQAENTFSEIIDCLSEEDEKPVIALASPYYLTHHFEDKNSTTYENVVNFIKRLQKDSNGMLTAFETVVPAYDKDKNLEESNGKRHQFNEYIRRHTSDDFKEVGGSFAKRARNY